MRSIYKYIIITAVAALFLASCGDEYGDRKESTPVIESASVNPATFTFGDSVTLTALVTDPATTLTNLAYEVVVEGKSLASGSIPLVGSHSEVSQKLFVPLVSDQSDNAPVTIKITANNVLKGNSGKEVTATGKRPVYSKLYLVSDYGDVITLTPQAANKDKYEAAGLTLDASLNYKIAEKVTSGKQVDYSGVVWGNVNGRLAMIDNSGGSAFVYTPNSDYTKSFVYDNYAFSVATTGGTLGANDLTLAAFSEKSIDGETFRILSRTLEKNQEYTLFGKLADEQIVYHLDFFERTAANKVKYLGETGTYTLNYNTYRQHVILGAENPAYPNYLLITGGGIGYPTKVSGISKEHAWWGFGNVRNFILMRKVADNVFQGTIMIHAKDDGWVSFKPYENTGWGGEKKFAQFTTVTGEDVLEGTDNWMPKSNVDPNACYKITINLNTNAVNVEKIIL